MKSSDSAIPDRPGTSMSDERVRARGSRRELVAAVVAALTLGALTTVVPAPAAEAASCAQKSSSPRVLGTAFLSLAATPGSSGCGYWLLDSAGGVHTFGDAGYHGSVPGLRAAGQQIGHANAVDLTPTPSGRGYWVLDQAGGIFTFGNAGYYGSVPQRRLQGQIIGPADAVSLAPTPDGRGYWVLDSAGGIHTFGNAPYYGSVPQLRLHGQPIGPAHAVAFAPTPNGKGYWVLDEAGGIFTFGNAGFHGSVPHLRAAGQRIGPASAAAFAPTPNGKGYWILDEVGGIFTFGNAGFHGSGPLGYPGHARVPAAAVTSTATGGGYHVLFANGAVRGYGDARYLGGFGGSMFAPGLRLSTARFDIDVPANEAIQLQAAELVDRLNGERVRRGVAPLRWSGLLASASRAWSVEMVSSGQRHGGVYLVPRSIYAALAENVFVLPASMATVSTAHVGWMRSEPHRSLVLNPGFDEVGVGVICSGGRMFATAIFGRTWAHGGPSPRDYPTPSERPIARGESGGTTC